MSSKETNESFSRKFSAVHRARLYPEEKRFVESSLGDGAIKFKLGRQGLRTLMSALNAEGKHRHLHPSGMKD